MTEPAITKYFWEKPLNDLSNHEWELLCDGCGRCCLKKLEDDDSGEIHYTRVICKHFVEKQPQHCSCYAERTILVPQCLDIKKNDIASLSWMPDTCAYRLRHEGKPLFSWHPLISGSRSSMLDAGISVEGKTVSEEYVHPDGYEEHIIRWVGA
jgi:uncharacterized cysteine cluster protein YcgN (CxxCxxCC family)